MTGRASKKSSSSSSISFGSDSGGVVFSWDTSLLVIELSSLSPAGSEISWRKEKVCTECHVQTSQ